MRVAIIGLGNICQKAYLPYITSKEDLEIIFCTRNKEKLETLSKKYRVQEYYTNVDELLDKDIDAAFIHTETESHVSIIEKLLKNNINVYVDKPISYSYEESKRMCKLAKEVNKVLMVGFNRRFAPMYRNLLKYEKPSTIKVEKNRLFSPKDFEVIVLDDFIHVIDTARFLLKDEIKSIDVNHFEKDNLLYNILVTLKTDSSTCITMMNRDSGYNEETLEYICPGNKLVVENLMSSKIYKDNKKETLEFKDWDRILYRRGFESIVEEFIKAVRENREPSISIDDALETHKLCDQILNQVISGR
jgi:virulence factor